MINIRTIMLLALLGLASITYAADTPFEFEHPQHEQQYMELIAELRCLVCQNQSLADSHAGLAQDLRNEVYKMVSEETPKPEIIEFLVARYGDFVLYRPPLKNTTLLLWFGPFILLLVAVITAFMIVKSRANTEVTELNAEQQEKLKQLLVEEGQEKNK
jgi:cytochrome c-type biogenesis protein CcmH